MMSDTITKKASSITHTEIYREACSEAREWLKTCDTLEAAWNTCKRPDWMFWALQEAGWRDDKVFRLFACWCCRETPLVDGRKVWDLLTDERSRNAVEVAEKSTNGEATADEWDAARAAAWAAARAAAWAAARAAAEAAAWDATGDAAGGAEGAAAGAAQADQLRAMIQNLFIGNKVSK